MVGSSCVPVCLKLGHDKANGFKLSISHPFYYRPIVRYISQRRTHIQKRKLPRFLRFQPFFVCLLTWKSSVPSRSKMSFIVESIVALMVLATTCRCFILPSYRGKLNSFKLILCGFYGSPEAWNWDISRNPWPRMLPGLWQTVFLRRSFQRFPPRDFFGNGQTIWCLVHNGNCTQQFPQKQFFR